MVWSFDDNQPIYLQIMQIIKTNIVSGNLPVGSKLPSVRELALEAGVNPNTMQRALAELERDGLLYSQRTSGRFVTDDQEKISGYSEELAYQYINTMVDNITALGYSVEQIPSLVDSVLKDNNPRT